MAVVQISRIQIRRGQKQVTGMPQLAGGELAWAVDTQELYIGNGSVAEGSPGVGNTKILTQNDLNAQGNLLNLLQYVYKVNDGSTMQTGTSVNSPISRTVQQRLDDYVNVYDFGAVGNGTTDDTAAIQRAINQLFLNSASKASNNTSAGVQARKLLFFPAGTYVVSGTLYIPSYANIVGSGTEKTIIQTSVAGSGVVFVNDTATASVHPLISTSTYNNQPRGILLKGLTIQHTALGRTCLELNCVRNSVFEDLGVIGNWGGTFNADSKGISLNAFSSVVTTEENIFNRVYVTGFTYNVFSKQDILNNKFTNCTLKDANQGFSLGTGAAGGSLVTLNTLANSSTGNNINVTSSTNMAPNMRVVFTNNLGNNIVAGVTYYILTAVSNVITIAATPNGTPISAGTTVNQSNPITVTNATGEQYGPRKTTIINCQFNTIKQQAVYVELGTQNTVTDCRMYIVGTNGGGASGIIFPEIYFKTFGNHAESNSSERQLTYASGNYSYPYIPEVAGHVNYKAYTINRIGLSQITSTTGAKAFRLPVSVDAAGNPVASLSYAIDYTYQSSNGFTRTGTLTVAADIDNRLLQLSDEYDYAGGTDPSGLSATTLAFSARYLDRTGNEIVSSGVGAAAPYSLAIKYTNSSADSGYMTYTYQAIMSRSQL